MNNIALAVRVLHYDKKNEETLKQQLLQKNASLHSLQRYKNYTLLDNICYRIHYRFLRTVTESEGNLCSTSREHISSLPCFLAWTYKCRQT